MDAHKARDKSRGVIGRMIERANKQGDKKAVTILEGKQLETQLLWKDQKNPYY